MVKSHVDGIKLPAQTAYGMTVVSLASSGGGLTDVGVFEDEKVYTVYVDMRATPEDPAPSCTLQYALLQPPTGADSASLQVGLTPPYPVKKEIPEMNAELIRRYIRRLVIVYATMGTDGKLQKLSVRESPDVRFNRTILAALNHWSFRPAQLNGQAAALNGPDRHPHPAVRVKVPEHNSADRLWIRSEHRAGRLSITGVLGS